MDIEKFRRFAELKALKSNKDDEIKVVSKEIAELELELLEEFAMEGVPRVTVTSSGTDFTVHTKRDIRAHALQGPEGVARACVAAGLGHLVQPRVNMQTLSAYLRDLDKADEDLPPEFEGLVGKLEQFSVGVRRA